MIRSDSLMVIGRLSGGAEVIDETLGHYKILDRIGAGGMGEVFLAEDANLKRKVALKMLPQKVAVTRERLERFRREAKILAALEHPGIVSIYSLEEADNLCFLTMQYVDGAPLSRAIPKNGFELDRLFSLSIAIADAVSAAHEKGVVHRDLKPGNIMITGAGHVKILDFGLAKLLQDEQAGTLESEAPTEALTGEGARIGTLPFMSPEQVRGEHADHRSDIFAMGVILYQMATGQYPFERGSSADLASSILRDSPSSVDELRGGLPHHMARIIRQCLEKNPDKRLQSSKDLRNALEDLRWEVSSVAYQPAEAEPTRRSQWWGVAVVAALVLAAVFAGLYFLKEDRQADGPRVLEPPLYLVVDFSPSFSGTEAPQYFRHGVTHLLAERLVGLTGVYVVPKEDSPKPDFVVEADVRRVGDSVNLAYRLVVQHDREVLAGEIFRISQDELFETLDRIGHTTAELLGDREDRPVRYLKGPIPTRSWGALDRFLVGLENYGSGEIVVLEEAARAFARASDLDEEFDEAFVYRGLTLQKLFQETSRDELLAESQTACSEVAERTPKLALSHLCIAEALRLSKHYLEAVEEYREAFERGSRDPRVLWGARLSFSELGRPQSEEAFWQAIIAADPGYWVGHSLLGRYHLDRGEEEDAITHYDGAIQLAPTYAVLYTGKFGAQYALGRFWEGIETVERSLEIEPKDHQMWGNLGAVYFLLRRFDEAIAAHETSLRLDPSDYRAHAMLGRSLYWAPGRREESTPHLDQAIRMCQAHLEEAPDDADAWLLLSWYQAMLGAAEESRESLAYVLDLRPNNSHFFYLAGLTRNLLGEEEQALEYLEDAVTGGYGTAELRTTIEVDNLRQQPRFQELITGR